VETPEGLEGLGYAAWWLDLADLVFDSRERAYRLYLARNQRAAAARVAVWLAWDCRAFRGESAVSNGWLQRARRLLDGHPVCSERAWLEVRAGAFCLLEDGDTARGFELASEGVRIAVEAGDNDLEMLGRSVQGLAMVAAGDVSDGMRRLDEVNAAVIAGELTDRVAIGLAGCYMIAACERVRDSDRAVQWCERLKSSCAQWGLRPLLAVCRTQYASICLWRGTWTEAESELRRASEELAASRPAMTGDALVRMAELRRRQGRLAESSALFDQVLTHRLGGLGRAELAFDLNDSRAAAELAERHLRNVDAQNRTERAPALELLVRALSELGKLEQARKALDELSEIAATIGTLPFRASSSYAAGCVALASRQPDSARRYFEDAVDLLTQAGAPFEAGKARIELARALGGLERLKEAGEEARKAIATLSELKADAETARGRKVLEELAGLKRPVEEKSAASSGLSRREIEVLRLVAQGLSNHDIAQRLFLSQHTIHRHVANIFDKLNVSTRAAAVAQASRLRLVE
jgi:DNA-binding CsgD family transcriptional regulator